MTSRFIARSRRGRTAAALLAVPIAASATAVGVSFLSPAAAAATASPTVTKAPPGTHGFPYMSDTVGLAAKGYVEDEFLINGTATAYKKSGAFGSDGNWQVTPGSTAPYKTRMVVRRPSDPAKFNGTVVVEWFNVSGQIDVAADWVTMKDELLRSGYAYVGVSAQKAGLEGGLPFFPAPKGWDPARYGTVSHPGDQYSYDIFSQAGQALRTPNGPNPLGNLKPAKLIAVGESQSAGRLRTYVNAVAPVARVYDGHLIHSGAFTPPLEDSPGDTSMPNPTRIRTDQPTPTMIVQMEGDVLNLGALAARQPNSGGVHTWEVTGSSHADKWLVEGSSVIAARTFGTTVPSLGCWEGLAPVNDGPQHYAVSAGLAALNRWIGGGPRPPAVANLTVVNGQAALDRATGLALGGVRLPDVTVPTRTLTGQRDPDGAGSLCSIFGSMDPWNNDGDAWDKHDADDPSDLDGNLTGEPDLRTLYPTHDDYVTKVQAAAQAAVLRGILTPGDAETIVTIARNSTIGG